MAREPAEIEILLAKLGRSCYARGWALGTSGNFSAVLGRDPFCLTITSTGLDKGSLTPQQFVRVDAAGTVTEEPGRPSAETALHLVVAHERQAGAGLHTHSVWSTIVSEGYAGQRGLWIEGYEILKGLKGVTSHTHREWLPILENDQNMLRLSAVVETTLRQHQDTHGFLLPVTGCTHGPRFQHLWPMLPFHRRAAWGTYNLVEELFMTVATKTLVHATCCAASEQWGVAHVTSFNGHLHAKVKCSTCGKEYTVDFEEHEPGRIADFESRLRVAAQLAIDKCHPQHGIYVGVHEV